MKCIELQSSVRKFQAEKGKAKTIKIIDISSCLRRVVSIVLFFFHFILVNDLLLIHFSIFQLFFRSFFLLLYTTFIFVRYRFYPNNLVLCQQTHFISFYVNVLIGLLSFYHISLSVSVQSIGRYEPRHGQGLVPICWHINKVFIVSLHFYFIIYYERV